MLSRKAQLLIANRIVADWYGDVVPDVNLQGLITHLQFLSELDIQKATELWTVLDSKGVRQVNREAWNADQKILKIAAGFFANKQSFIPLKAGTLFSRIEKGGPYKLLYNEAGFSTGSASKWATEWLDGIKSTAITFLKAIKKWQKASDKEGDEHVIQHEFTVGPYRVFNNGGYPAKIINPVLKYLEEGSSKISPKLQYGDVFMTTSKENRGNNTLAFYIPSRDTISLLVDKVKVGHPVESIIHEFGHRLWFKFMSATQKKEVSQVYHGSLPVKIGKKDIYEFLYDATTKQGELPFIYKYHAEKNPGLLAPMHAKAKEVYHYFTTVVDHTKKVAKEVGVEDIPHDDKIRKVLAMVLFIDYQWSTDPFLNALERKSAIEGNSFLKWFNHEINEHLLKNISKEIRDIVDANVGEKNLYPTEYSKQDVDEFFAENYRTYCLGQPMSETMKNLLKGY